MKLSEILLIAIIVFSICSVILANILLWIGTLRADMEMKPPFVFVLIFLNLLELYALTVIFHI